MSGDYGLWWHKGSHKFFVMLISNTRTFSYFCNTSELTPENYSLFEEMPQGHFLVTPEEFNDWGQE